MALKKEALKELKLFADLLEFSGANRFKVNAFRNAINVLRRVEGNLETLLQDGSIARMKGIGKGILSFLYEFSDNGTVKELEELMGSIPEGIVEILNIRGLGVKKVKQIYEELGIKNLADLERACKENKLATLKGFTEKTEQAILDEIRKQAENKRFMLFYIAEHLGAQLVDRFSDIENCKKVELTGELRRKNEVISSIDIICRIDDINSFKENLANLYNYNELDDSILGEILLIDAGFNFPVKIYLAEEDSGYFELLFQSTGAEEFLRPLGDFKSKNYLSEDEIFGAYSIPYVIPEMREKEYWNAPENLRSNSNLQKSDFNGMLHFHTTQSDGANSLLQMARGALEYGYKFLAVCDHSKSAFYANGLTEERVLEQKKEIASVSDELGITIFHGIESDILKDGSLDYSNEFMKNLDFVVASVHSVFSLPENEMTARIIRAIENPYTDVLGHPTGRLLLARDSYKLNIKKVIDACVQNDVAIEINASPHRLDLDWRNVWYAREVGCKLAINPDAHSVKGIWDTDYGINIARKAGVQKEEVINCYSETEFKRFLNRKVKRGIG